MNFTFTYYGRLPGMNEFISAQRTNKYKGADMKRKAQKSIEAAIASHFRNFRVKHPVKIHYTWIEPNMKRDLDNITGFGHKVIQDALVSKGIIANDGWKDVVGYTDNFKVDKKNPRIIVTLEEIRNGII